VSNNGPLESQFAMTSDLPAFSDALISDDDAQQTYSWLGPMNQQEFLAWISSALSESERNRRIQAAVDMLAGREIVRRN
jgi:uncharacterized protein YdeI (YjbR/CyaY-like superfamily)